MALKDWKIYEYEQPIGSGFGVRFRNTKKMSQWIQVAKYKEAESYMRPKPKWSNKWYVLFNDPHGGDWEKLFKTKVEALKYARAYMRKH